MFQKAPSSVEILLLSTELICNDFNLYFIYVLISFNHFLYESIWFYLFNDVAVAILFGGRRKHIHSTKSYSVIIVTLK